MARLERSRAARSGSTIPRQSSGVNYASLGNGSLTAPVFGAFDRDGRGTFVGQDQLEGRTILVRFIITRPSASVAQFEQAYSADGGATWETNWIATDTRR